jgi:hypothetical protein
MSFWRWSLRAPVYSSSIYTPCGQATSLAALRSVWPKPSRQACLIAGNEVSKFCQTVCTVIRKTCKPSEATQHPCVLFISTRLLPTKWFNGLDPSKSKSSGKSNFAERVRFSTRSHAVSTVAYCYLSKSLQANGVIVI